MSPRDELHECPIDGCTEQIHVHRYMCHEHWLMTPPKFSAELSRAYDRGYGYHSWHFDIAFKACVEAVNDEIRITDNQKGSDDD